MADHGWITVQNAEKYARRIHAGQLRDDGQPYITHLKRVYRLLLQVTHNQSILAAAWLHDVLEDSDVTFAQLSKDFDPQIAMLVWEVTKDAEGKFSRLKSRDAVLIKFADRLSNLADMNGWDNKKQSWYLDKSNFWKNY